MHFNVILVSLFTVLATACRKNLVSQLPECARSCLAEKARNAQCDMYNLKCQCTSPPGSTDRYAPCVRAGCSKDDLEKTSKVTDEVCRNVADVGTVTLDTYSASAARVVVGRPSSAFVGVTSSSELEYDVTTGVPTNATAAAATVSDAYTSATASISSALSNATHTQSEASPTVSIAAADRISVGMGFGAALMFALAL
ncbi:hypothetical protein F4808DRAFT_454622 [Astrocystis sublimbata]|nr:hypothetical protein F4808DRAFT_454622 [Astrocystis sublimbata]